MWHLDPPSLTATFEDVDKMVLCSALPSADAAPLKRLIRKYHNLGGQVSERHFIDISEVGGRKLLSIYEKTRDRGRFCNIRKELNQNIDVCPYCAINEAKTLDHYVSKKKHPELAACRLNLVPLCHPCNIAKGEKKHTNFVHPYYFKPYEADSDIHSPFLEADISYADFMLVVSFRLVREALRRDADYHQLLAHWQNLKLNERCQKGLVSFLRSTFLARTPNAELLKIMAEDAEHHFGINDWRSAILRGLLRELSGENQEKCHKALLTLNEIRSRNNKSQHL